jgi:aspartate aminotransferase
LGIDPEQIARRITGRTRVLVLNTPHNPTGAVLAIETLAALAEIAVRHDLTVLSDEIYGQLAFGIIQPSIAALPDMPDRTVIVDGFSKAYAMTGWRLGYGIGPTDLMRRIERLIVNTTSCAPPFVQRAGLAALTGPQDGVSAMRESFRARRDLLVRGLDRLRGIHCAVPRGGFYAFPFVAPLLQQLEVTVEAFADFLLERFGLACLPGTAFGPGGDGHLRLSFAAPEATLRRAIEILAMISTDGVAIPAPSGAAPWVGADR